nr:MAG TPA: hypothetical protein [Caudoviricetes sp.]
MFFKVYNFIILRNDLLETRSTIYFILIKILYLITNNIFML